MLVLYAFREAWQSLIFHRSRTLSMGFGLFWAVFIFALLVGIANGFHNGVSESFEKYGTKTILIYPSNRGATNYPIPQEMVSKLKKSFKTIQQISSISIYTMPVNYETKNYIIPVLGCPPAYALLAYLPLAAGRFFTPRDEIAGHSICVLGTHIKEKLFGKASAIGKYIFLGNMGLQVVGVLDVLDIGIYGESDAILVSNTLFSKLFPKRSHYITSIRMNLEPSASEETVAKQLDSYFARHLRFDVKDEKKIFIFSIAKYAAKFHRFFKNIFIFNAIIGICLLITGMVTVSSMMLISIHERRQELAIRKVLSNRSVEIVAMVLSEVIIVTLLASIIGFLTSYTLIQSLNKFIVPLSRAYYLSTLTYPPIFIGGGYICLLLGSSLAAIIPAIKALRIKPIQALGTK